MIKISYNNMGRKRKRKPIKLNIKTENLYSIIGLAFVVIGILIIISFSNQGEFLTLINDLLYLKLGVSMLFLPFIFIASGLVMFQTKWAWSKPHVLLGALITMLGVLGFLKSGEIGLEIFNSLARLITNPGSMVVFFSLLVIGFLIMSQMSFAELMEGLGAFFAKIFGPKVNNIDFDSEKEMKKAKGFKIPQLSLGLKQKLDFNVNDNS